ncbi:MAG TPA: type IX secretion system outer membrane channel protein PorV [Dinghuibacter sp.]|jgi:hypothetical protein|uniref:type IX secretion system outer membrane channel protein PorV n=1 Tax=Dinghuibacter sp. TaxID=2024697 RepID=UPI002CC44466|nr:type IX secretion system outer membrane channel protein PorV [Dinghuibacter sp.]HTJ11870.1 type IX secretion system outer membrane channel protein PorV [Dinghuibacter sp.]
MKRILSILCACGYLLPAHAQTKTLNVATTAVPFLRITPDARSGAMANTGIATGGGSYSIFHNMASTALAGENAGIGAGYTPWLQAVGAESYLAFLSGYKQFDDGNKVLAAGIRYFNMGSINLSDENGANMGVATPREYGIDIGYGMKLGQRLSAGLTFRYIHSQLATGNFNGTEFRAGNAAAADLSLFHDGRDDKGAGFTWGINLSNLGTRIAYTSGTTQKDYIPATLGIGAAYTIAPDDMNALVFTVDVAKLLVPVIPADSAGIDKYYTRSVPSSWFASFNSDGLRSMQYSGALEYAYDKTVFLRAGYNYESASAGGLKYVTAGIGLQYHGAAFDFAYLVPSGNGVNQSPLNNTLRFSVRFALDKKK